MCWQSCGGRWWLAASRSVPAGAWGSSCIRSGFATILRPDFGSLPSAGCVETSPAGLATLRSTSANAIQRTSTTGLPGPAGPGPGGAGAGTDLETDPDSPDSSRACGSQVDCEGCPEIPGRPMAGATRVGRVFGGTPTPPRWLAASRPWVGWSARSGLMSVPRSNRATWPAPSGGGAGRAAAQVTRRSHAPAASGTPAVRDRASQAFPGAPTSPARQWPQRTAFGIPEGTGGWVWLDESRVSR